MAGYSPTIKMAAGQRYGRLTAVAFAGHDKRRNVLWRYRCDCGREKVIQASSVRCGYTISCGCFQAELARINGRLSDGTQNQTHGMRHSPEYYTWNNMRSRCTRPSTARFPEYGGRGIKVCERWQSFENFYADMGPRPSPKHSIDRIDVNGHYSPENCRWALVEQQVRNRRSNVLVTFDGREMILKDACKLAGVNYHTAYMRITRLGWTVERALVP